jgi:hypothetical protein
VTAYSNIINQTVAAAMSDSGFDARLYAPKVYDKIGRLERKRTSLATIAKDLRRAANDLAVRAMKEREGKQLGFGFLNMPGAVAVDADGHKVKFTLALSQLELQAATDFRRKSRSSLDVSIKDMEAAQEVAKAYWRQNPDWNLGQCLEQATKDLRSGAAA